MMNAIKNRTKKDKLHFNRKIRTAELKSGMAFNMLFFPTQNRMWHGVSLRHGVLFAHLLIQFFLSQNSL